MLSNYSKRFWRRFHYLDSSFRNLFFVTIPFFIPGGMEGNAGNEGVKEPFGMLEHFRRSLPLSLSFPPPKMRSALKGTRAQHFCHYRVIFTGGRGHFSVKDGRMCASAYRRSLPWFYHRFSIPPSHPPPPLFKTYFFIYYSRDDLLLGRRSRDYIFQNATRYKAPPTAKEGKSRGELD